ncbi:MAG TPA: hypothetical protein VNN80_32525 [Polyangiaceae bacterium]|nr:hypothetical protein [Polyangiaceae bacterium]
MADARRPIDDPAFFDRPAPPGRSRESAIVLDGEGRFWDHGEPVTHRGMQEAFSTWIRRHPRDGRYVLCNGYDWTYFRVDDVPFFVRALGGTRERPTVILSDQTEEPLDPAHVRLGARDAVYLWVKAGAYEARFSPAAQLELAPFLVEASGGGAALCVAGETHAVTPRGTPGSAQQRART